MEHQKNEHKQKMKKMEAEMEQVFEMKVKEKMQKLKDSEIDVSTHLLIIVFSLSSVSKLGPLNVIFFIIWFIVH